MSFLAKKSLSEILGSTAQSKLKKTLGSLDIVLMGVGSIVGGGIFVLSGFVSAEYTGPAIVISYCIAGMLSLTMAFFYLELTTMVPNSAVIYNYSYNIFGEFFAWLGFWLVVLEFATAAASVAVGWSKYFYGIFDQIIPLKFVQSPFEGGYFNVIAACLIFVLSIVLILGVNLSKKSNNLLVMIKFVTIFLFIVLSAKYFNKDNLENFMPFGFKGVLDGSALLFYSFNGYSLLSSTVEECKHPAKNLLLGLIFSVLIALIIYLLVAFFLNGSLSYTALNVENPLALVFKKNNNYFLYYLIIFGAIISMITGVLINMYAITRIVYSVGRDNLLTSHFTKLIEGKNIPYIAVIATAVFLFVLVGLAPIKFLSHISSISSIGNGIIILIIFVQFRKKYPKMIRIIKIPYVKVLLPIVFLSMIYLLFIQFLRNKTSVVYFLSILTWIILGSILYLLIKSRKDNIKT